MFVVLALLFALVAAAGIWMYRWQIQTADRFLQEWAAQRGLTVVDKAPANDWYTGPGNRAATNKQVVYRIRVQDEQGRVHSGLARIGSKTLGTLERIIDVQFDP